jgi:hypothetical protein
MDPRTAMLLEAPVGPTILRLALPNVVVMVVQASIGLIETYFVAKLGLDALAGMALVLNGSARWEENESGNLETTIKSLSHGFRIGPGTEIHCANCGVKARIIGIAVGTKQTG